MSDDEVTVEGGNTFLNDEEQEPVESPQGEKQNKTFIIAVGVLGGLLVCAIGAFLLWALILNPRIQAQNRVADVVEPTSGAVVESVVEEGGAEVEAPEATEPPTWTPEPTATSTPVVGSAAGSESEGDSSSAAGGEAAGDADAASAEASATPEPPTATPTKTPAPARTPTPRPTSASYTTTDRTPQAGLGEVALVLAAGALLVVLFLVRRLRHV